MIGFNGGLIGGFRDTTTGTASVPGVWTANEQVVARRRGQWAGVAWTPAQITTALWLDASDSATITTVSGAVSQWNDKSNNSRHVSQSTAVSRPTVATSSLNGLSTLAFNGNQFLQTSANFPITGNAAFSVFCVYVKTALTNGSFMGWGSSQANLGAAGFYDSGSVSAWVFAGGAGYNTSIPSASTWFISSYSKSPGAINTTSKAFRNGVDAQTGSQSTSTPNIAAATLKVGQWADYTTDSRLNGNIAELIVIAADSSTAGHQQIEGYLAWKWGLASSLPANHPYKTFAPTIQ